MQSQFIWKVEGKEFYNFVLNIRVYLKTLVL